jgi:hypothetical protein
VHGGASERFRARRMSLSYCRDTLDVVAPLHIIFAHVLLSSYGFPNAAQTLGEVRSDSKRGSARAGRQEDEHGAARN